MGAVLELSDFAIKLATGGNPAHLATVNADGAPQVTPVWIDYEDGHLLVDAVIGTLKERNIRRDPRVAVSISQRGNSYTKVDIRGEVVGFIEGDRAIAQMDVLAQRYLGVEKNPWAVPGQQRVIMKIAPIRVAEAEYDPNTGGRAER
jgi:PPOX class probable F420-dependent enzyme